MKEFAVSADLDISARSYFLEKDSVVFRCLLAKLLQALDLGSVEFEREDINEAGIVQVWQSTYPSFDKYIPSGIAKLVKKYVDKLVYTDILSHDPAKLQRPPFEIEVTSIAPVYKDKTTIKSRLIIESLGPRSCRQTLEGSIDVRVFGIGRTAEVIIVQQLAQVYRSIPAVIHRWVQLRAELIEREGSEWLLLGRPNTQMNWTLQEYAKHQKGRCPDGVTNSDNKENPASVGLSEEQVFQKAQLQLRHEKGGLKRLPTEQQANATAEQSNHTDQQASPTSCTPDQAAGAARPAGFAAAEQQEHAPAAEIRSDHAQEDMSAIASNESTTALPDRDSSVQFVTPDRAASMELQLANVQERVPLSRDQPAERAEQSNLNAVPQPQPNGIASSTMPPGTTSHRNLAASDHVGTLDAADDQSHGQPSKKRRPNIFMQCFSCGASATR